MLDYAADIRSGRSHINMPVAVMDIEYHCNYRALFVHPGTAEESAKYKTSSKTNLQEDDVISKGNCMF